MGCHSRLRYSSYGAEPVRFMHLPIPLFAWENSVVGFVELTTCSSLVYMHKLHHGYFQNVRNPEEFGFPSKCSALFMLFFSGIKLMVDHDCRGPGYPVLARY